MTVPVRCVVAVLAATLIVTVPLPEPVAPAVTPSTRPRWSPTTCSPRRGHADTGRFPGGRRGARGRVDSEGAGCRVLGDREGLPGDRDRAGALRGRGVGGDAHGHGAVARAGGARRDVIQEAALVADHVQPVVVVTPTLVDSPAAGEVRVVGLIAKVQGAAFWVTVKVCPAIGDRAGALRGRGVGGDAHGHGAVARAGGARRDRRSTRPRWSPPRCSPPRWSRRRWSIPQRPARCGWSG